MILIVIVIISDAISPKLWTEYSDGSYIATYQLFRPIDIEVLIFTTCLVEALGCQHIYWQFIFIILDHITFDVLHWKPEYDWQYCLQN